MTDLRPDRTDVTLDIDDLVRAMTLDEKASLTAGIDAWHTAPIARLGIPSWCMTDGPSGARGPATRGPTPSLVVPCGSALGATWNPELVENIGAAVGHQALSKGCRVLLAPTVNLHRSPLNGRTFEAYAEDPLLAGRLAAAFVRGAQYEGVACTVKHFAGNEAEFERYTIDSVIDERALRELYLVPFELAVREGGAHGVMTAYNRLNGIWCGEHAELITTILRDEWGFEGFTVTDWYAVAGTTSSPVAGLDVEMPGPGRCLGPKLATAVRDGELGEAVLDAQVRRLLSVFGGLAALGDPADPPPEEAVDLPEHRALARRASAESMVLLRNNGVLPFDASAIRSLAVIGPNAARAQIVGGGSASLIPHHRTTPIEALRRRLGHQLDIVHFEGCELEGIVPPVNLQMEQVVVADGKEVLRQIGNSTQIVYFGPPAPGLTGAWTLRASGTFVPETTGGYEVTLIQSGRARLAIDGQVVLDGTVDPPPIGIGLYGFGSEAMTCVLELVAGRAAELQIELDNDGAPIVAGVHVGIRPMPPDDAFGRAVAAAAASDAVVVIVGTNDAVESENHDRSTLALPGPQDALVRAVCAANRNTAVVVNAGAPVSLPWADDAPALLDVWFGGQEMADALVDVVFGEVDPGGRLPTTFPERIEHTAAFGNFPGEDGEVRYGESVLMGYRWHEARHLPVSFPFGHGLSYTTFRLGPPEIQGDSPLLIRVPVTNTGDRRGSEVVQLYVEHLDPPVTRPPKELKAFAKVALDPGVTTVVELELDDRAFAYWRRGPAPYEALGRRARAWLNAGDTDQDEPAQPAGWHVAPGEYRLHVGRSSRDIHHVVSVKR